MPRLASILASMPEAEEEGVEVLAGSPAPVTYLGSIPIDWSILGSIPCNILGSSPRALGSIPWKVFGSIALGSNHLGSIPMLANIFGSMLAIILGSNPYMAAIILGSIIAAIILGSIMLIILGSIPCSSFGSMPENIFGSSPEKVVDVEDVADVYAEVLEGLEYAGCCLEELERDCCGFSLASNFLTMLGSSPRLLRAFSSRPCSIFGSNPSSRGSRSPVKEEGMDIMVDVAEVGTVDVLVIARLLELEGDIAPLELNILGSRPSILGSIPPRSIFGSRVARNLGSDNSLGSSPASILGSIPINDLGSKPPAPPSPSILGSMPIL